MNADKKKPRDDKDRREKNSITIFLKWGKDGKYV